MKHFKPLVSAIVFSLAASTAMAERINVASNTTVDGSVSRLTQAIQAAGARFHDSRFRPRRGVGRRNTTPHDSRHLRQPKNRFDRIAGRLDHGTLPAATHFVL